MFNVHCSSVEAAADLADVRKQREEACWSWKVQQEQECLAISCCSGLCILFDTFLS